MAMAWLEALKSRLEQEKAVRMVANDPALTAELLLMFKVILADGEVRQRELDIFKRICRDSFGLDPDAMDGVYRYLSDFAYEISPAQAAGTFADLPLERRQRLLDHMIAIAEADRDIDKREERFLARIGDILGFDITEVRKGR
ncbi:TerB family tellurite resistance protein [Oricola sp.]|uniref:TerB family tellurite resistance protein n=1 Tax=Oricola sp. TaxID=1979950 RepID=UPI0025CD1A90|nr:TerB family tellurite resistance protein [Oricola sp.]MCI5076254.1 TerB family tellurite resistance protein [Oricola sp.]